MGLIQFPFKDLQRLRKSTEFEHVYQQGKRNTAGPLLIFSVSNDVGYPRLGISVPKRVGNAVKRNAIKRRCREAFRLQCSTLPNSIDIVINVRPHEVLSMQEYASFILCCAGR